VRASNARGRCTGARARARARACTCACTRARARATVSMDERGFFSELLNSDPRPRAHPHGFSDERRPTVFLFFFPFFFPFFFNNKLRRILRTGDIRSDLRCEVFFKLNFPPGLLRDRAARRLRRAHGNIPSRAREAVGRGGKKLGKVFPVERCARTSPRARDYHYQ